MRRNWSTIAAAAALAWGYWPTLRALERTWATDPRYSHGYLIPFISLYIFRSRRDRSDIGDARPDAGGLALIGIGMALHLGGAVTNHEWVEAVSIVPSLAGLCVVGWGWGMLRAAWPSVAFLVFMIPLPYRVELALGGPMQRLATKASGVVLQTAGWPALEEGNVITLGHSKIGVVEACNGLSMLTFFFAISVASVLVGHRAWIERTLIVAGAIPIALIANIARITTTAVLVDSVGHGVAGMDFHDLAGYLMMPFALALLCIENAMVSRLFSGADPRPIPPSDPRDPALMSTAIGTAPWAGPSAATAADHRLHDFDSREAEGRSSSKKGYDRNAI